MSITKISSYQKMKQRYEAEISALQDDIMTLVEDKDFMKVIIVKAKHKMIREQISVIWGGDSSLKK